MISSSMLFPRLVIAFIFVVGFVSGATLPEDEVEALHLIARRLGKSDWNFSVDPCSGLSGWTTPNSEYSWFGNAVTCNCTFNNNIVCHVVSIILRSQNLTGSVPRELVRLPFLQEIVLQRNYLSGSIPREWGSMNLVTINLSGNRLSGPIPRELTNISTLIYLALAENQLSGTVPPELGNLPQIERLYLESNNFSGELPKSLARLRKLGVFNIGDNNFSGSIPNFIQNWTNIETLVIQASGLAGPIPSGIASLTRLEYLMISDLSGNESSFPPLSNLKRLQTLILRSCNIVGELPPYIGELPWLITLDLSFNKLSGPIPSSFSSLSDKYYIYLTGNSLSGQLPAWMQAGDAIIDLSYNNLTSGNSASSCQQRNLNLFASSKGNTSGISCLGISRCEQLSNSLRINCGGGEMVDDRGNVYAEDANSGGPSNFFRSTTNWGFSSTGNFIYHAGKDSYILTNRSSVAGENSQLYMDARLSPLSLTYYGFCMINGNYSINLHFAEIMFTNDRTYISLGRRIFDVYIQGKLVLKDLNIADEAGGVNKAITKNFPAIVTDNTLDIRFYWAGKGTTGIPVTGVYGPLISAISADSDKKPPSSDITLPSENGNSISAGAIIGIVLGVLFTILLVLAVLWWKGCLKRERTLEDDLKGVDLNTGSFTLRHIKAATNNFDPANKIGEGGFGPVFKGLLSDGKMIAVKQLSSKSKQGNREFVNEIGMISALQHPHLVKLYGCCIEGNQLLLIYEYLENNSLARALFGPEEHQLHLDWPTRHKICVGIARGLAYLHEESRLKIVHRDIKATNVLLDKNLIPKISDFGLAKLDEEDNSHISTRVAGTLGYMAPEYAMRGHLTDKADVYSFGVVLFEVVSGRSNITVMTKESLLDLAKSLKEDGNLMELVDARLGSNFNEEDVLTTIKVGLLCTNLVAAERPTMSAVVSMLEGRAVIREFVSESSVPVDKMSKNDSLQQQIVARDVPLTASSASTTGDLYPITVDTVYWEKWDP